MNESEDARFPCKEYPSDPAAARLLGVYDQRQEGLLMQRIKVHAGRITPGQWRAVAQIAAEYTPGFPLHLTTRQDIELHGVTAEHLGAVQAAIAAAGLTGSGACGDTLRNVTTCPGCGICAGTLDVSGLADTIRATAESLPWIRRMPRKFKISLSGCEKACARPWINDLGLIAREDGAFRAILGGSLGARPGLGIEMYDSLEIGHVVPLAIAALRLFNAEADRKVRSRARLRHVRERLGKERFRAALDDCFRNELHEEKSPAVRADKADGRMALLARLALPLGDIEAPLALALADTLEGADAALRIGFEHDLFIYNHSFIVLPEALARLADGPRTVACPGSTWCARGIADSRGAAEKIRGAGLGGDLSICISGCPNNCSHAAVADIGFVGRISTINGARTECYRLLAGGGKGTRPALAEELHPSVPAPAVHRAAAWLAAEYQAGGGEAAGSFGDFVRRSGYELSRGIAEIAGSMD